MVRKWQCFDPRAVACAVLVVTTGCSGVGRTNDPFRGTEKSQIVIEVDNQGFNQATVWILSSAGERRLGTINGKVRRSFTVQWPRSDELRLRVRVMGARGFTTARKLVFPGEVVEVRIT